MTGSTSSEALASIRRGFEQQKAAGAYDDKLNDFMANEVVPEWKRNSPVDTGAYRESVQVTQRARMGKGEVGATDEAAGVIEYGSKNNPEFAPRLKTRMHFDHPGPAVL